MGEPFLLRPWELDRLTWDEIFVLYLKPKRGQEEPELMEADDVIARRNFHERWAKRGLNWFNIEYRWNERENRDSKRNKPRLGY